MPKVAQSEEAVKNVHVSLPEHLYQELKAEAASSRRSANILAREASAQWLETRRQANLDQAVLEYATAMAGTEADLHIDLEAASLECIGHAA